MALRMTRTGANRPVIVDDLTGRGWVVAPSGTILVGRLDATGRRLLPPFGLADVQTDPVGVMAETVLRALDPATV